MRIVDITATLLSAIRFPKPLRPAWAPGTTWSERQETVVRIKTDVGFIGASAVEGDARAVVSAVGPHLIGQDPRDVERHVAALRAFGRAWVVEPALWDIVGKAGHASCQALGLLSGPTPGVRELR